MSKQIHKSVRECLSKIKISNKQIHIRFRRCTHPRTPSFDIDGRKGDGDHAVTLSDIDQFLFENFRSLYQEESEEGIRWTTGKTSTSILFDFPKSRDPPPAENLCGSDRFFVSSDSSSSLTMDDKSSTEGSDEIADEDRNVPDEFIVIFTHSQSPYDDFRRSMQEMVEARLEHSGKMSWGFLEELLSCHLDLNNKKCHRYILNAFVDLIVDLRGNPAKIPTSRQPWNGRGGRSLKGVMQM